MKILLDQIKTEFRLGIDRGLPTGAVDIASINGLRKLASNLRFRADE